MLKDTIEYIKNLDVSGDVDEEEKEKDEGGPTCIDCQDPTPL